MVLLLRVRGWENICEHAPGHARSQRKYKLFEMNSFIEEYDKVLLCFAIRDIHHEVRTASFARLPFLP